MENELPHQRIIAFDKENEFNFFHTTYINLSAKNPSLAAQYHGRFDKQLSRYYCSSTNAKAIYSYDAQGTQVILDTYPKLSSPFTSVTPVDKEITKETWREDLIDLINEIILKPLPAEKKSGLLKLLCYIFTHSIEETYEELKTALADVSSQYQINMHAHPYLDRLLGKDETDTNHLLYIHFNYYPK